MFPSGIALVWVCHMRMTGVPAGTGFTFQQSLLVMCLCFKLLIHFIFVLTGTLSEV